MAKHDELKTNNINRPAISRKRRPIRQDALRQSVNRWNAVKVAATILSAVALAGGAFFAAGELKTEVRHVAAEVAEHGTQIKDTQAAIVRISEFIAVQRVYNERIAEQITEQRRANESLRMLAEK